jgi:hypothetical protein
MNQPPVNQSGPSLSGSYESYFGKRPKPLTVEERVEQRRQLRSHMAALFRIYGHSDCLDALSSALIDEHKRLISLGHYDEAQHADWIQDDLDGLDDRLENRMSSQEERSYYDD